MLLRDFMKLLPPLAAALVAAGSAYAELTLTLVSPSQQVRPGAFARIELLALNPDKEATALSLPERLPGELLGADGSWAIDLIAEANGPKEVQPRSFATAAYLYVVPERATGPLILTLAQPQTMRAVVHASATGEPLALPEPQLSAAAGPRHLPPRAANARVRRSFVDHFSVHEPIYFLFGPNRPAAKFQFSFKYRFLNGDAPLIRDLPVIAGAHFAYTQRSIWDITGDSSPFFDTSYMPELVLELLAVDAPAPNRWITWLGAQGGFLHESNGRDGLNSRSANMLFLRPSVAIGDLDGWRLILTPRLVAYVDNLSDNPDLSRFRGYGDLRAVFGKNDGIELAATGRVGRNFNRGSIQFDLSYPVQIVSRDFATYLHLQYFAGYGESLITYDRRTSAIRGGFSLVR
jgi:phospholipase A1/A2